ncbi:unnamed protein product [Lampetra planeri]
MAIKDYLFCICADVESFRVVRQAEEETGTPVQDFKHPQSYYSCAVNTVSGYVEEIRGLKLEEKAVTSSPSLCPVRCPQPTEFLSVEPHGKLKCITVPVVDDQTCMNTFPEFLYWGMMVCAGQANTDNCMYLRVHFGADDSFDLGASDGIRPLNLKSPDSGKVQVLAFISRQELSGWRASEGHHSSSFGVDGSSSLGACL